MNTNARIKWSGWYIEPEYGFVKHIIPHLKGVKSP